MTIFSESSSEIEFLTEESSGSTDDRIAEESISTASEAQDIECSASEEFNRQRNRQNAKRRSFSGNLNIKSFLKPPQYFDFSNDESEEFEELKTIKRMKKS